MPFLLPNTDSFQEFIKTSIVKPYRSLGIMNDLLEHFEIDLEEGGIDEDDDKEKGKEEQWENAMEESLVEPSDHESSGVRTEKSNEKNIATEGRSYVFTSRWDSIKSKEEEEKNTKEENPETDTSTITSKRSLDSKYVFKQEMILKKNSQNPLLVNGRGKYIGRQLSNNFYNDMREVSSETIMKAKVLSRNQRVKVEVSTTEKEVYNARRIQSDEEEANESTIPPLKQKKQVLTTTRLGSTISTLNVTKTYLGTLGRKRSLNTESVSSSSSSSKISAQKHSGAARGHHGAAILAARASLALRKKTRN